MASTRSLFEYRRPKTSRSTKSGRAFMNSSTIGAMVTSGITVLEAKAR